MTTDVQTRTEKMVREQKVLRNFRELSANPYPGRGIVIGGDETSTKVIQIYWLMGRSPSSRNRVLEEKDGAIVTAIADPSKLEPGTDTSLIIYPAMMNDDNYHVVSNGSQTDILDELSNRDDVHTLYDALVNAGYRYEPDAPNFTPRITAVTTIEDGVEGSIEMMILQKSAFNDGVEDAYYCLEMPRGMGYCIHTYEGNGDPLPSWNRLPYLVPLVGTKGMIAQTFWGALNRDNRVSLVVKEIDIATGNSEITIINRFTKVVANAADQ